MLNHDWKIAKTAPREFFKKFPEYSPIVSQLLYNRGITTQALVDEFVNPDYDQDLHDPFLMTDMDRGVTRILQALTRKEKILVHGDYDADGVSGAVLLFDVLRGLKSEVDVFLPSRQEGGYGMNPEAIKKFKKDGVNLILSVDCGITNVAEVALAKKLGMDVVVTDHHTVLEKIPDADAVINPSRPGDKYPFKQLAGVGVAFKMVQALKQKLPAGQKLAQSEKWYLDLVAVGTVADCAPIIGENRTLVKYGLQVLARTKRAGLRSLMERSQVDLSDLDTYDIGFRIGPRLNAAGRLKHSQIAFDLLMAASGAKAMSLAQQLDLINRQRQVITDKFMKEAETQIGEVTDEKSLLVAYSENWPSGVVGLVAGKLCERHARPVLILEKKKSFSVGSARSTAKFNIIEAIRLCDDLLDKHGGHSQAAGCTVPNENLEVFARRLKEMAKKKLTPDDLRSELMIDGILNPAQINWELHDSLRLFEPHGFSNEKPRFVSKRLQVAGVRAVGNLGKHLKLDLRAPEAPAKVIPAIAFGFGEMVNRINFQDTVDVAYELEANEWNGHRELQLNILDIRTNVE